jgi:amino acid adenylation domain-containing protein/non-ribosomal peptide synthase protein (TIGR01720 family)
MGSPSNVESIHRLTSTQEGILFHAVQNEASGLYLQQFSAVLAGDLDVDRFRGAWAATVARHPALRALFTWRKRPQPLQVVQRVVDLPLEVLNEPALLEEGPDLDAFLERDRKRGLPLDAAPLMRLTVVPGTNGRHRLVWTFHHIALDGWSMRIVLREVLQRDAGHGPDGPAPSHEGFLQWLGAQSEPDALAFWKGRLGGFDEPTRLAVAAPSQGSEPTRNTHPTHEARLSAASTAQLTQGARDARVTLSTILRAVWAVALARYSNSDDVVFGATVSGRPPEVPGMEEIVGMFIHTIPVRARVDLDQRVSEWCAQLQRDQLDAIPYETTSLAAIQRYSDVSPGTPLFESILVIENHAVEAASEPDSIQVEDSRYLERSHYPLALLVVPGPELELILVRDGSKVTDEAANALLALARRALLRFADDPTCTVRELAAPTEDDLRVIESLSTPQDPKTDAAVDDVIERIDLAVRETPAAVALRCPGEAHAATTYAELGALSRRLALGLMDLGVTLGDLVGVRLPRGREAVATILAVLRCGAAYVPIDPEAPEARIRAMEEVVDMRVIVGVGGVDTSKLMTLGDHVQAELPSLPVIHGAQDRLAYVLFTSGSTGTPKGVEITREALARSTGAREDFYDERPERFLLLSPLHFDSSVAGLFWTLSSGGTLVLPALGSERDARRIIETLDGEGVSHTLMLPSLYEVILETAELSQLDSLSTVIVAGEACTQALVLAHAQRQKDRTSGSSRLFNEYGPTEATVWATATELTGSDAVQPVPIGAPIGDVGVHILDQHLGPVPVGVAGELYLSGPTLARGYAGDPEQTAARFIRATPRSERLYRTGDQARFDGSGRLSFLGRVDRQVKIRGQRIELGEVEAALSAASDVVEAAVCVAVGPGGQPQLVAFVTGPPPGTEFDDSKALSDRLTGAMQPQVILVLESLPRTATGKIDRPSLAPMASEAALRGRARSAVAPHRTDSAASPSSEVEATLLALWREVLGIEDIALDEDFYGLGGDSLTSIRLVARAHKAGLEVELADFAADPTIRGMAMASRAPASSSKAPSAKDPSQKDSSTSLPLTPIQAWFFSLELPRREHWNQAVQLELPCSTEPDALAATLAERARELPVRHDALRLRFEQTNGEWRQRIAPPADSASALSLEVVDLRGLGGDARAERERSAAESAQAGFALDSGPVIAVRLFITEAHVRALLVAHHLVVDAVSWNTLAEELIEGPLAQPSGATYGQWVEALAARRDSSELLAEAEYWAALHGPPAAKRTSSSVASEASLIQSLASGPTSALLSGIHGAYGTRPREILLAALARTMARYAKATEYLIDVEGHGREALAAMAPELDVSSTVGWFTTAWPLRLAEPDAPDGTNQAGSIKRTKEAVRAVPGNGLSFGLLAHMATDERTRERFAALPPRELLFNFLGNLDGDEHATSPVALLDNPLVGRLRSEEGARAYPLELNAWVSASVLHTRWSYSTELHSGTEMEELGQLFLEELSGLIDHCQSPSAGGVTPSDFPLAGVDQAELDRIAKLLGGGQ